MFTLGWIEWSKWDDIKMVVTIFFCRVYLKIRQISESIFLDPFARRRVSNFLYRLDKKGNFTIFDTISHWPFDPSKCTYNFVSHNEWYSTRDLYCSLLKQKNHLSFKMRFIFAKFNFFLQRRTNFARLIGLDINKAKNQYYLYY